jgi:hypothetical protein
MLAGISKPNATSEEKLDALELVLKSNTFARSDQLKRFLRYVCDMEIAGRAHEISEYSIGTEALGKPPGYSPGEDSSVRSRAHALRQKLQEFYELEYTADTLRIEIRKGSYTPHFVRWEAPATTIAVVVPPIGMPQVERPRPPRRFWGFLLGFATAGILATAVYFLAPSKSLVDPILQEAWGGMLRPGSETVLYIGAPPAALFRTFKPGTAPVVSTPGGLLPAPQSLSDWYNSLHEMDNGGDVYMQSSLNVALMGDVFGAASAIRLVTTAGGVLLPVLERNTRLSALRGKNTLIIGSPNYSPYAGRILRNMPFSVHYDPMTKEEVISDGPPDRGAKRVFRPRPDYPGASVTYGLITVLPGRDTIDSGLRIVVFSGVTSAGTQGAAEFFASAASMRDLMARIKKEGHSHFPAAYQIVVRCALDRGSALNSRLETYQILKQLPLID